MDKRFFLEVFVFQSKEKYQVFDDRFKKGNLKHYASFKPKILNTTDKDLVPDKALYCASFSYFFKLKRKSPKKF